MRNAVIRGALLFVASSAFVACTNPAVDPNATFAAKGTVVDETGRPLQNAEVRLIKYSSDLMLVAPSVEELFAEVPRGDSDLGLDVSIAKSARTGADGTFSMTFTGKEIEAPGGFTTAEGLVEVATVLLVVRDPRDGTKRSGVYTYPKLFMQSDKEWGAGTLNMFAAEAVADTTIVGTTGQVKFSWKKVTRSTQVSNTYRVTIQGESGTTPVLVIRCSEGDSVDGGCAQDTQDASKVARFVSAYSLLSYYSDANGKFVAYVEASSPDYRYVAKFAVPEPVPDIRNTRDPVAIQGVWAVGPVMDLDLLGTPAVDGNPMTRKDLSNQASAIYVHLALGEITDAGVLNSLVKNAANSCLLLEFAPTNYNDLAGAKGGSDWVKKGKFCGENGAKDEVSALAGFDTTSSNGVVAAWMRVRAESDGGGSSPQFLSIGEVAVFKKR